MLLELQNLTEFLQEEPLGVTGCVTASDVNKSTDLFFVSTFY